VEAGVEGGVVETGVRAMETGMAAVEAGVTAVKTSAVPAAMTAAVADQDGVGVAVVVTEGDGRGATFVQAEQVRVVRRPRQGTSGQQARGRDGGREPP
jgi:hypothetical protein